MRVIFRAQLPTSCMKKNWALKMANNKKTQNNIKEQKKESVRVFSNIK